MLEVTSAARGRLRPGAHQYREKETSMTTSPHSRPVRLAVLGYGNQGGYYARLVADEEVPGMVLGAVCDIDPERCEAARELHPGVPVFRDAEAMMASGLVDAVVTTLPHYLHPDMTRAALAHDLHVLVEKPVGVYVKQAEQIVADAAARPDRVVAVMFNQRTNPLYRRVRELVQSGAIGELRRSTWVITTWWRPQGYFDSSPWRASWGGEGGGVLINQAPHQLDLWQWICGMPERVVAHMGFGVGREITVENEVAVLASYAGGASGQFVTATNDLAGTDRLEIVGTRGRIVVTDSATATLTRYDDTEEAIARGFDAEGSRRIFAGEVDISRRWVTEDLAVPEVGWGSQHKEILRNFAAAIHGEEPLVAECAEGLNGVRLANAMHYSAWTGQWVDTDLDADVFLEALNDRIRAEGRFPQQQA